MTSKSSFQGSSVNVRFEFDWVLEHVSVVFHGATARYEMTAFDTDGNVLNTAYRDTTLGDGGTRISVVDDRRGIKSVVFGEHRSRTIITEVRYR